MMFLAQVIIFLKGSIPLFPSVTSLDELLFRSIRHLIYVAGTQVMVVNETESQSPIRIILSCLKVRPFIRSLEDCNHLVSDQRSVGNERVGEWTDVFRVGFKHRMPPDNLSSSDHILIVCKVLDSISAVCGITGGTQGYQIISQPISEGLYIYSVKLSYVLFHRFQGLGPVHWINSRYHFGVLMGFLHVPMVVNSVDHGDIKIYVCACAPNPFEVFDIINHAL